MTLDLKCFADDKPIHLHIDTVGDPSVGLQAAGLEAIEGDCEHVEVLNVILEWGGEKGLDIIADIIKKMAMDVVVHYREEARLEVAALDTELDASDEVD